MEHHLALAVELFNRTIKFFWLLWAKLTCFDLFVTDRNLTGASSLQRLWLLRWIWCLILLLQLVTWGDWGLPYSLWSWSLQMAWLWKRLWRFWTIFKVGGFLFIGTKLFKARESERWQTKFYCKPYHRFFFVCISSNWIIEAIGRGSNCYPFFHVNTFAGLSIAECLILLLSFTEMEPQKTWRDALDFILDSRSMKKHILNSDSLCEVGITVYGINKKLQRPQHLTLTC